jgi:hypothetical protein
MSGGHVHYTAKLRRIHQVSWRLLRHPGCVFNSATEGHIQTDVAATCGLAGLMVLQEFVPDLWPYSVGSVLLSDSHKCQGEVLDFMAGLAVQNGLDPRGLDDTPSVNQPLLEFAVPAPGMPLVVAGSKTLPHPRALWSLVSHDARPRVHARRFSCRATCA